MEIQPFGKVEKNLRKAGESNYRLANHRCYRLIAIPNFHLERSNKCQMN